MADSKVTGLTALTTVDDADIFYVVDDIAGTATSKKITRNDIFTSASITGEMTFVSTSTTASMFTLDCNAATGTTGKPALRIDSENTDSAALYISSAVDGSGTSSVNDDSAVAIQSEGLGGCAYLYRNVSGATRNMFTVHDDHADSEGGVGYFLTDQDASAGSAAVTMQSTNAAYDEPLIECIQAGVGSAIFVDDNCATGATGVPSLRIDSERTDSAALYITSAVDGSGTSGVYDDYAVAVVSEGAGGCVYLQRSVAGDKALMVLEDAHADTTKSTLSVSTASNAGAGFPCVAIAATDAAYDQSVLEITQAGVGIGAEINSTGNSIALGINANALTTSEMVYLYSDSADASARNLMFINNTNVSAVGTTPFKIRQDAPTSTNFKKYITLDGNTIWVSNGTTPNGNLSGLSGDICMNGTGGQPFYCTGTTNWTGM